MKASETCNFSIANFLPTECKLCPRACGANRRAGQLGACGAGNTLRLARAALHFWEEPLISAETGSGTVFFSGCPLRCVYCQNASIALNEWGKDVSFERLVEILLELQDRKALNINFVTPTHYAPVAVAAVKEARKRGLVLPIVWNTSGYETPDAIRALAGCVDVYLTDFKYASSELAKNYSNAPDYPRVALAALKEMLAQRGAPQVDEYLGQTRLIRGVVVRHLLLPGHLKDSKAVVKLLHESFGNSVMLSLMNQYTPVIQSDSRAAKKFPELLTRPSNQEYEELLDYADSLGIEDYFWQDGEAAKESFIPPFDYTGL